MFKILYDYFEYILAMICQCLQDLFMPLRSSTLMSIYNIESDNVA